MVLLNIISKITNLPFFLFNFYFLFSKIIKLIKSALFRMKNLVEIAII